MASKLTTGGRSHHGRRPPYLGRGFTIIKRIWLFWLQIVNRKYWKFKIDLCFLDIFGMNTRYFHQPVSKMISSRGKTAIEASPGKVQADVKVDQHEIRLDNMNNRYFHQPVSKMTSSRGTVRYIDILNCIQNF